jgi:cytochrome P450
MTAATRYENRLLWQGNPMLFALLAAGRHSGAICRVPRLGWVVCDPVLARRVLNDAAHFSMVGEGGVGHMWAQLFGDEMAAFFVGASHTDLRTRARDLFTEESARALVERELAGRRLLAGDRIMLLTYVANNGAGPFDIRREYVPETRQLWFGAGRHLCLGAAVARAQLARLLETLTSAGRPWRVVSRRAARRVLVPAYASLLVAQVGAGDQ